MLLRTGAAFPAQFVEDAFFTPVYFFGIFIKYQMAVVTHICTFLKPHGKTVMFPAEPSF